MGCDFNNPPKTQNTSFKKEEEYWLFVGEKSTGKTVIIDSLLNSKAINSLEYPQTRIVYLERSFFISINNKEAKIIEEAINKNGKYRIFFIVNLDRAKVREVDLTAIEMILDAIDLPSVEFNIIVNGITKAERKYFDEDKTRIAKILKHLNTGKYKTDKIIFIDHDRDFSSLAVPFLSFGKNTLDFMYKHSASIFIPANKVNHIDISKWDEKLKDMKEKLDKI